MNMPGVTGAAIVAGVAGRPIRHSLSPTLHNAWLDAAGIDGAYAPFSPQAQGFTCFIEGLRGGVLRGLNITLPFKEAALAVADTADDAARSAAASNLLLFHQDGRIEARNTDGAGLLYAFARQAPGLDLAAKPAAVIGAGGAARGAVATLFAIGVSDIRIVNRTKARAEALAAGFSGASVWDLEAIGAALDGVGTVINATSTEIAGGQLDLDFSRAAAGATAMDMLYQPLETRFLKEAKAQGLQTVDGLDMLIGQAMPSFEAFFGAPSPKSVDARAVLLAAMQAQR